MIQSKLLKKIPLIRHEFGTKEGLSIEKTPWYPKQIHSDAIIELPVNGLIPESQSIEADAVMTAQAGLPIAVRTADCVPVLLVDTEMCCIAAVHAGWRGTAHRIVTKTIEHFINQKGADVKNLYAAIGPCIHFKNYEVDETVLTEMEKNYSISSDIMQPIGKGKYWLDLVAANHRCLHEAGLQEDHIDVLDYCTFERSDLLYSCRRDGQDTGRNISWIELR